MMKSFSCCPHGAVMLCEDASEYESDLEQVAEDVVVTAIKDALQPETPENSATNCRSCNGYDPVIALRNRLSDLYAEVRSYMTMDFAVTDTEAQTNLLDTISGFASRVADELRCVLVKQRGLSTLVYDKRYCSGSSWAMEDVRNNLGYFIKNMQHITQQGYDKIEVQFDSLDSLYRYDILRVLNTYMTTTEDTLPDTPIDYEQLRNLLKLDDDKFTSFVDMFDCLMTDMDRLARLERTDRFEYRIGDIIQDISHGTDECNLVPYDVSKCNGTMPAIITFISRKLRLIKIAAYNYKCSIYDHVSEGEYQQTDEFVKVAKKLVTGIVDMFFIAATFAFMVSYQMRREFAIKDGLCSYVNNMLSSANK